MQWRGRCVEQVLDAEVRVNPQRLAVGLSDRLGQTCTYQEKYPTSVKGDKFPGHGSPQLGGGTPSKRDRDQDSWLGREFQWNTGSQFGFPSAGIVLRIATT